MDKEIDHLKEKLFTHPVYGKIKDLESIRVFMAHHVICVLDFMTLVKNLRLAILGGKSPIWMPPHNCEAARFMNEIMLDEESDEISEGEYKSHFELYCQSMEELGGDTGPVLGVLEDVKRGKGYDEALAGSLLPDAAKRFSLHTYSLAHKPLAILAAVFCQTRESIIPQMFQNLVGVLNQQGVKCPSFLLYLERHVAVDEEKHGPMADKLMNHYCYQSAKLLEESKSAAKAALKARLTLWDEIVLAVDAAKVKSAACSEQGKTSASVRHLSR